MPRLDEAVRYAEDSTTTEAELRRACEILQLDTTGAAEELRGRLRAHLSRHERDRPVICLNPGPIAAAESAAGPRLPRPAADEHAPVFAEEIALVPEAADFARLLRDQVDITRALAVTFGEAHADLRYQPEKWSVRETIGHLADCERVLSYRLLRALRADGTTLPGFDHLGYVTQGRFRNRPLAAVVAEFVAVRSGTVALVASAPAEAFAFRLSVGSGSITGLALAYLIAGHERHHQSLLRTRYFPCLP
jgi:hypothetical protein